MNTIYLVSYIGMIITALVWIFGKAKSMTIPFIGQGFWLSLLMYIFSLFFSDIAWIIQILLLVPLDVSFFVVILLLFNRFVSKSKILFTAIAAVLLVAKFFLFDVAQNAYVKYNADEAPATESFSDIPENQQIITNYDKNAEILLDLKNVEDLSGLKATFDQYGISYQRAFTNIKFADRTELDDYLVLNIPENQEVNLFTILEVLRANPNVDGVEINELVNVKPLESNSTAPNNTDYGLNDPGLQNLWGFTAMQMEELYAYLKTNAIKPAKVAKVAILDTGIDSEHEDIQGNYVSTDKDYDEDKMGHGTHCAGIAAAVSNNSKGIASFSADNSFVQVTSIKVLSDWGGGSQESVIEGIIRAADSGADVISMSLGGSSTDASQRAYSEAVAYANKAGAIVVVAAGNDNENANEYSPANADGVITVAAIDENLNKAEFSNFITDLKMGIAAPGVNIYSTFPKNEYKFLNGTSMATPYVAGLIGLLKSLNPAMTTQDAYQLLRNTGATTKADEQTGKLIQPAKAVQALAKSL